MKLAYSANPTKEVWVRGELFGVTSGDHFLADVYRCRAGLDAGRGGVLAGPLH